MGNCFCKELPSWYEIIQTNYRTYCYICGIVVHNEIVYCTCCSKSIGHNICVLSWSETHSYCPYCYKNKE